MKRNIFIFAFCIVCFWACGPSAKKTGTGDRDATVVGFESYRTEPFEAGNYFSDVRIVPLETDGKHFLSDVLQVEFIDSLVFICDDNNMFLFDDSGAFISQIGRRGRGAGEFVSMRGFFVDRDSRTVTIIDPVTSSFVKYGFDGRYISSEKTPDGMFSWGYYAMLAGDGKVFVFNSHNPTHNMAYVSMDIGNQKQAEYFCTYDPVKIENYTYHFAKHPMTRSGENIHFTMPLDNTVYEYSDGDVEAKYYIETPLEMIPKDVMQETEGTYLPRLAKLAQDRYFGSFTDIFETDGFMFLHYMAKLAYPGLYVMDKSNNTGSYFLYPSSEEVLQYPVFPFSASDGNKIISVVPATEVMKLKDYMVENEIDETKVSVDLQNSLSIMDEDSNPLLVIYTVKQK